jgi:ABC-type transport system involved in cytochrome c biogenesis permease subunit
MSIPLGKIPVPTPGTSVALTLTAAQKALLPPSGLVHKIEAWADTADTGASYVKLGGVTIAPLSQPANGHAEHWHIEREGNWVNPLAYAVDADVANNGPFVTLWVE